MKRKNFMDIVVLVACAAGLAGCAAESHPAVDGQHVYWQRLAATLKDSAQPREQALAAQMLGFTMRVGDFAAQQGKENPSDDPAIESAISDLLAKVKTSDDAVALSLATQVGVKRKDHKALSGVAERWQAVEPDNLAPRLFTEAPIEAVLAGARDATRYETHGYDQIRLMTSVFRQWPMSEDEMGPDYSNKFQGEEAQAAASAFGIWAAFGIPAYQKLIFACRDEALESTLTRRDDCLHVGKVLASNSSDLLSRGIGISILERAANTPDDIALATTLRRNKEWQQHHYFEVFTEDRDETQYISDMLRLLKAPGVDNEIELMEVALRERGIALVPPEDWQPPQRG
jgi:hypothetical protein